MSGLKRALGLGCFLMAAAGAVMCLPASARADADWTLSGVTFSDGATASGTFVTNDSGDVTSTDITTTSSTDFPGGVYDTSTNALIAFEEPSEFGLTSGKEVLILEFNSLLTAANSPDILKLGVFGSAEESSSTPSGETRRFTAGEAIAGSPTLVPEPMSLALLGTGLVGLVFVRRRYGRLKPA